MQANLEVNFVSKEARIGKGCTIAPNAHIGNAKIGNNCVIYPFAYIGNDVILGDNVEVYPGAVIGKAPYGGGSASREPIFEKRIIIGNDCSICPHAVIRVADHSPEGDVVRPKAPSGAIYKKPLSAKWQGTSKS